MNRSALQFRPHKPCAWLLSAACTACFALSVLTLPRAAFAQESFGQPSQEPPNEDRFIYKQISDVFITTSSGVQTLSALWHERPVLLTMIFSRCARVCSPFLRSLNSAVSDAGGLGADYRVVVLSFDPQDTVADMQTMASELGLNTNPDWIFGVASPSDIRRLAAATGFWFQWDPSSRQFDHPSLVATIDRGRLVRLLAGASVPSASLREGVQELRGKFVASYALTGKVAFRCFEYDPNSGRYSLDWGLALMLLPGTCAIVATAWVFFLLPTSRKKRNLI
jgi:protein SCO1